MNSFINIQVIFDKPYEFSLLRENLTWQQLSTVIQTSIVDVADKEPLSLYYSLNSEISTLSDEDGFSQLLLNNKDILGLRLYGQSQENMEPVHILPLVNDAFKRLFDLVQHHNLESDIHLSKMVGILAARIAYSPHEYFNDDLTSLENMVKDPHSIMRSRKMLLKHRHRCKLHKKIVHHRKHPSHSNDGEIFECLSHHPSKEQGLHRCGRREFHYHHNPHRPSDENLNDIVYLTSADDLSSETGNNEHVQDKYAESDASMSSLSDSESENEQEEGGLFGRRGGRDRFGRHGRHKFGSFHPCGRLVTVVIMVDTISVGLVVQEFVVLNSVVNLEEDITMVAEKKSAVPVLNPYIITLVVEAIIMEESMKVKRSSFLLKFDTLLLSVTI